MNIDANLKLSYYKVIADLCPEHDVYLVQHVSSKQIFVQKNISVYNKDIYYYLLEHHLPNTPIIFEVIEDEECLFIIEEYINGFNLHNYVQSNDPLPEQQVISIITKLCTILEPLHSMNPPIIHRDIKASNVILSNSGEIYLIDFNAAKYASPQANSDTILLGTQGYAAPEQYGFGSSSIQTDIYALGMLANYLLHGSLDKVTNPSSKLDKIIARCTELNPSDRYSSLAELRTTLSPSFSRETNKSWVLPGFRSHNTKKMLGAIVYYILAIAITIASTYENVTNPYSIIAYKFSAFIILIGTFFICADYRGVKQLMPFSKSPNSLIKTIGIGIGICLFLLIVGIIISLAIYLIELL